MIWASDPGAACFGTTALIASFAHKGTRMLGDLEQIVMLATLRLDGEGYGVTIQDAVRRAARRELTMGTIHKTLVRLEAKGMIASRMGDPTPVRGGRAKRYYAVTSDGLTALRASLSAIRRLADGLEVGLEPG